MAENIILLDHIAKTVKLTRQSDGSFLGLCPFHDEKTPSFRVLPNGMQFLCYSCGADGESAQEFYAFMLASTEENYVLKQIKAPRAALLEILVSIKDIQPLVGLKLAERRTELLMEEIREINDIVQTLYSKHTDKVKKH